MITLQEKYNTEIVSELQKKFGFTNVMTVPKPVKVIVNMGIGIVDKDVFNSHLTELAAITGQKPQLRKAKSSISNFKLREDMNIGAKVTLRGVRMYEFLDRLINIALPRIRDFRGVSANGFDGSGNYTVGLKDQAIFPEVDPNKVKAAQGMDITIVTSGSSVEESREMIKLMGMPFAG
ncbi:MAG: 50S ribosomal protein L5 [Kiritimatiellae bacterium]|jgi:large subunit ribosomal protein L5|nr:50S ribosomal protein L5 [Kiritimatiellia bacterium]